MIFGYNGDTSLIKFYMGEDGITVDLPNEGKTGTFTSVKELAYALSPILKFVEEKFVLASCLSRWFGGDKEEIFSWLMK